MTTINDILFRLIHVYTFKQTLKIVGYDTFKKVDKLEKRSKNSFRGAVQKNILLINCIQLFSIVRFLVQCLQMNQPCIRNMLQ